MSAILKSIHKNLLQRPRKTRPAATSVSMLALEQRYLLDAAAAVTAADVVINEAAIAQLDAAIAGLNFETLPPAERDQSIFFEAPAVTDENDAPVEVVFIDGAVSNVSDLLAGVSPTADVYILDPGRDGVEQIAEILSGYENVDAVHILAHGQQGEIELGDTTLDSNSIAGEHAASLAAIGASLSADGDIYLYGCNFAEGDIGRAATAQLAAATGADIAASTNNTGAASLGGDWVLEFTAGKVNSDLVIEATQYQSILAPLLIDVTGIGATIGTDAMGRTTATYVGGGDISGTSVDIVITVLDGTDPFFGRIGDDIAFQTLAAGTLELEWSFTVTDTGASISGAADITISDIDGTSTTTGSPGAFIERVTGRQELGFLSYTVNNPTDLDIVTAGGEVQASGTVQDTGVNGLGAGRATAAITFNFADQESFIIEYEVTSAGRVFTHDGDGEFVFSNPVTVTLPQLDLDGNNSTATGADYAGGFVEDGGAVAIVDGDVSISGGTAPYDLAIATLTNATANDELLVNGSAAASGMIGSLSYTIGTSGNEITVTISGTGTAAEYQTALQAITFRNNSDNPDVTDRTINVTIRDSAGVSGNPGVSTISITPVNDAPVLVNDSVSNAITNNPVTVDVISNDTDVDGTLDPTTVQIVGTANPGDSLFVSGQGTWSVNPTTGAITFTPVAGFTADPTPISYTARDNSGALSANQATVTIDYDVQAPVANNDAVAVANIGDDAVVDVLANDSDPDGALDPTSVQITTAGASPDGRTLVVAGEGTWTVNPTTGVITFEPLVTFGNDPTPITYTVADNDGNVSNEGTVFTDYPPFAPIAADDTVTGATLGAAVTVDVLNNDTAGDTADPSTVLIDDPVNGTMVTVLVVSGEGTWTVNTTPGPNEGRITFTPLASFDGDPTPITYTVADADVLGDRSNPGVVTIDYVVPPVIDLDGPGLNDDDFNSSYTENGTPADLVDNDFFISDEDGNILQSAELRLTNAFAGDQLLVNGSDAASGSVNGINYTIISAAGEIIVSFSGPATIANYEAAIASVAFSSTSDNPATTTRVIDIFVNDGEADSNTQSTFVSVSRVNDEPIIADNGSTADEGSTGNIITSAELSANDPDNATSEVEFTVTATPTNGTIYLNGVMLDVGDTFTQADLDNNLITYDHNGAESGFDSFQYTVTDNETGSADQPGTHIITISAVNDDPVATDDGPVATTEDTDSTGNVLANDNDADGDMLEVETFTITGVMGTFNAGDTAMISGVGTLTIAANGDFTFTPDANYTGPVPTATYTVIDNNGGSDTGDLSFADIANVNDDPVAVNDLISVSEDVAVSGDLFANNGNGTDSDVDGDMFTVSAVNGMAGNVNTQITLASGALLTVNANGTFDYDPNGQFEFLAVGQTATDSFTYEISDGNGGFDTATVTLTVNGANDDPVATDDGPVATTEDTDSTGNVLTNDNDADGDMLVVDTFIIDGVMGTFNAGDTAMISGVGTLTIAANGDFTFTPDANYTGPVPTATYTVIDNNGGSDTGDLSFADIANVNDDPIATDDGPIATTEDTDSIGNVLTNDNDADGDMLVVDTFIVDGVMGTFNAGDTAMISGVGTLTIAANGDFTFSPDANYTGPVPTATYTVIDNNGGSDTGDLSFDAIANANDDPIATDDGPVATTEDTDSTGNVLVNDNDADGDMLVVDTFIVDGVMGTFNAGDTATIPGVGTLTIAANGDFTFSPNANYTGPVPTATYTVIDNNGGSDTGDLSFQAIANVNDDPIAADDGPIATTEDTDSIGNVLTNDNDADGDMLVVNTFIVDGVMGTFNAGDTAMIPGVGTLTIAANGDFTFTPDANYTGPVPTATYTVIDNNGGSDTGDLSFAGIANVNDAPELTGASIPTQDNNDGETPADINVTGLFTDDDGDTLTYSVTDLPPGLTINSTTGVISGTLTTSASQGGPYNVTVTATDPSGAMVSTGFTWNVSNLSPTAVNDGPISVTEDVAATFDPRTNDNDPDGDAIGITAINGMAIASGGSVTLGSGAVVTLNANGTLTFDPAADQNGNDSFSYTITDADGATASATVSVDIAAVNDAPDAVGALGNQSFNDAQTIPTIPTAGLFDDVDGDTLTYSATGLPAGLMINATTGEITGTVDPSASTGGPDNDGVYDIVVTATDPDGETASVSAQWSIANPAPVAGTIDSVQINDGDAVSITTNTAFTDPDGDTLTFSATGLPPYLSINPTTGEITGVAPADASESGPFSVTVTANDGEGGTASETFLISAENPAPEVTPTPDQTNDDGEMITPLDVASAFNDPDGDALTFTAMGLPPGLTFDPGTGLITGTITANASQTGPFTVAVTATDADGAQATDTFVWTVNNPAPSVSSQIPNQSANDSEMFDFDTSPFFTDTDGDATTFSANGLPPGLSIDPATGEISGTLANNASAGEPYAVTVTVDDGEGGTASDTFVFSVNNLNPGLVAQIDNQDGIDGGTVPGFDVSGNFNDPDGDPLTFTADNLPPGLTINPMTGVISGTIDKSASQGGPYSVIITASDGTNEIVDAFIWNVDNPSPVLVSGLPDQTDSDGDMVGLDVSTFFDDPDNDGLTFTANGLPPGLTLDPNTGLISGTLPNDTSVTGPFSVTITATDGDGDSVVTAFTWNVENIAPVATGEPADLSNNDSDPVNVDFAGFFSDGDNDPITYTASGLPPGLTIDPATGVVSGTLASDASQGGPYMPIITATDDTGDSASVTFGWTVTNPVPVGVDDTASTLEDTAVTIAPLANDSDADGDPLSVTAINGTIVTPGDVVALPDGAMVAVNADGTLTFTPAADANGPISFTYTVSDGEGGESTATISVDVEAVPDAPRVVAAIPPQTGIEGEDLTVDISGSFNDPDGDDLIFSADNLPPGLSIDPATGLITGAPDSGTAIDGPFTVIIIATDPDGNEISTTFVFGISSSGADIQALINFGDANAGQGNGADANSTNYVPYTDNNGLGVNGAVLDGANGLRGLNGLPSLSAESAVLSAVNGASSLRGLNGADSYTIISGDRIRELTDRVDDRFARASDLGGVEGAEGFSSRTNVAGTQSTDPSTKVGQFSIDTFVRSRVLYVEVYDTIDDSKSRGFKEFRATLGDGRALPEWISYSPDGLFLIDRPAHIETVTLKITGLREGGGSVTRIVEIDTPTGEIRDRSVARHAYGLSFSDAVDRAAAAQENRGSDVNKILQGQQ